MHKNYQTIQDNPAKCILLQNINFLNNKCPPLWTTTAKTRSSPAAYPTDPTPKTVRIENHNSGLSFTKN